VPEFAHALVIGKFYPLHAGHSELIRAALSRSARVTVQVLASSVESIPLSVRADWVRQEHPTATVVQAIDDAEVDYGSSAAWDAHMAVIRSLLDAPVDAVFAGEPYGRELAERLGAQWVQVDRARTPVSGTAVRADLAGGWFWLPLSVRRSLTPRVVVLGAESTGSTTLATALAQHYGTLWVPEYGRAYTDERGGPQQAWRSDEFTLIAERQFELERQAIDRVPTPLLVCDTDVLATALWHERYVGTVSPTLEAMAAAHRPVAYILTGDEIAFVQDGTRDGEHIREGMQQRFRDELAAQPVPWVEVRGTVDERLAAACAAIEPLLAAHTRMADPLDASS
jgi:HTH-type transcriptional regulator, transcriptional repressor of NAD biosynthesis genes